MVESVTHFVNGRVDDKNAGHLKSFLNFPKTLKINKKYDAEISQLCSKGVSRQYCTTIWII